MPLGDLLFHGKSGHSKILFAKMLEFFGYGFVGDVKQFWGRIRKVVSYVEIKGSKQWENY